MSHSGRTYIEIATRLCAVTIACNGSTSLAKFQRVSSAYPEVYRPTEAEADLEMLLVRKDILVAVWARLTLVAVGAVVLFPYARAELQIPGDRLKGSTLLGISPLSMELSGPT